MLDFLSRTNGASRHALLQGISIDQFLEDLPATLLIMDRDGGVVYRNRAAMDTVANMTRQRGERVLDLIRIEIRRIVREVKTYPYNELVEVREGKQYGAAQLTFSRLPDGFLLSWRDMTAELDRIHSMEDTADQLTKAVQAFTAVGNQLASDTAQVSDRAHVVADGTNQLSASIRDISRSTATAANTTGTAVHAANMASEHITKLSESSVQIEAVSQLINSIAAQTNLLALNATIEAARAGEAGRGFAVVAGEVKELAGRTSEATGQIATMIEAIQSDSGNASATIQRIVSLIGQIEEEQTTIATAVEEQTATASDMTTSSDAVVAAAKSSAGAVEELRTAVSVIADKAEQLRKLT
jgi:hypothetical protein